MDGFSKEIDEIVGDCDVEGWNGYDAAVVSEQAGRDGKLLAATLAEDLPRPCLAPSPAGIICFCWHDGENIIEILIYEGSLIYGGAGPRVGKKFHGKEEFSGALPPVLLEAIRGFDDQ